MPGRAGLFPSGAGRAQGLPQPRPRPGPSVDGSVVTPLATVATSRLRVLPGAPAPSSPGSPGRLSCFQKKPSRGQGRCPCPAGVPGAGRSGSRLPPGPASRREALQQLSGLGERDGGQPEPPAIANK